MPHEIKHHPSDILSTVNVSSSLFQNALCNTTTLLICLCDTPANIRRNFLLFMQCFLSAFSYSGHSKYSADDTFILENFSIEKHAKLMSDVFQQSEFSMWLP